jgi:medium-chain acyl-[acyl-carrier-protein] hydrolase
MSLTSAPASRWIFRPRPHPTARLRLLCFPYAGGGPSLFRTWPAALPPDVEVLAIALPGRESRSREPLFDRLTPLIDSLVDAVGSQLRAPFAIYGHSFGAMVGFGVAQELRRRALGQPVHFFASGRRAPQLSERIPLSRLPDAEFLSALGRMGGIPDAVLAEPELMEYFLPILRADIAVSESGSIGVDAPLRCPITAMGGVDDDRVTVEELEAWRAQTTGAFEREMFPGGHFFLHSEREGLLRSMSRRLRMAATGACSTA